MSSAAVQRSSTQASTSPCCCATQPPRPRRHMELAAAAAATALQGHPLPGQRQQRQQHLLGGAKTSTQQLFGPVCARPRSARGPPAVLCSSPPSPSSSKAGQQQQQGNGGAVGADDLPQSREQSVQQAVEALRGQLSATVKPKKGKGFRGPMMRKLSVEVPIADTSAEAEVQLALELAAGIPRDSSSRSSSSSPLLVVFCREASADAATGPAVSAWAARAVEVECFYLGDCFDQELDGTLVLVAPEEEQLGQVEELLSNWRGPGAVLVNPGWTVSGPVPSKYRALVAGFDTVYCFMPLAIQGFLSSKEGAVFKWVPKGRSPASEQWLIFSRGGGGRWEQVGRQARRPKSEELELALYNAVAANSPITQGAKLLRRLTDKVTGGGGGAGGGA